MADGRLSHVIFATRSIHDTKIRELEARQRLKEEMVISGALSQEYSSLFKIDAKTGEMSLYRTDGHGMSPELLQKLMENGNYETVLGRYIDTFVIPEDRERLRESSKLQVMLEQVPDVGLYKQGYRRILDGIVSYYEMNVVKTVDAKGDITFILAMRDVDEEMRRQYRLENAGYGWYRHHEGYPESSGK